MYFPTIYRDYEPENYVKQLEKACERWKIICANKSNINIKDIFAFSSTWDRDFYDLDSEILILTDV